MVQIVKALEAETDDVVARRTVTGAYESDTACVAHVGGVVQRERIVGPVVQWLINVSDRSHRTGGAVASSGLIGLSGQPLEPRLSISSLTATSYGLDVPAECAAENSSASSSVCSSSRLALAVSLVGAASNIAW